MSLKMKKSTFYLKNLKNLRIKKQIFEEDLLALADEEQVISSKRFIELLDIKINCGLNKQSKAKVKLNIKDEKKQTEISGTGPIDAVFKV